MSYREKAWLYLRTDGLYIDTHLTPEYKFPSAGQGRVTESQRISSRILESQEGTTRHEQRRALIRSIAEHTKAKEGGKGISSPQDRQKEERKRKKKYASIIFIITTTTTTTTSSQLASRTRHLHPTPGPERRRREEHPHSLRGRVPRGQGLAGLGCFEDETVLSVCVSW